MAVYRTPDERFRDLPGYPFQPHYVEIGGMRVHYLDEGQGPPVLMLHGEPTWSYLYRKMIPPIARRYRAVAPDYVGFGRSDKWTEVEKYTFDAHYRVVEGFVEALDLREITVVVQDWGGPLGLRFATQHPERMARLVILNTGLFTAAVVMPAGMRCLARVRDADAGPAGGEHRPAGAPQPRPGHRGRCARLRCPLP